MCNDLPVRVRRPCQLFKKQKFSPGLDAEETKKDFRVESDSPGCAKAIIQLPVLQWCNQRSSEVAAWEIVKNA